MAAKRSRTAKGAKSKTIARKPAKSKTSAKPKVKGPAREKLIDRPAKPSLDLSLKAGPSKPKAIRPLVAGNWKMNGLQASRAELQKLMKQVAKDKLPVDVVVAPPATLLLTFAALIGKSAIRLSGQDCHSSAQGAFTGDVSAEMLKDAGAKFVIVGHSERRSAYAERDPQVKTKAEAALRAGLMPIICVGESEAERDAGWTTDVVSRQIAGSVPDHATPETVVIAYEPVWAIGTGRTPTSEEIRVVHGAIREALVRKLGELARGFRILYGGSVKPSNSAEILRIPGVDGALVGGASLKADDFFAIIGAYSR